jgi:eukaryotic-like serine/threonine-protein kinase
VSGSGERPARLTPATLHEGPAAATSGPPAPRPDDRYVIEREIAQGGMGRVFVGRDRRLGRDVAVKVLLDGDPIAARRFEREARVAARLQHPGIVTVYDAGFWPTGEPYLVMKHVLGRSFDRVIADAETLDDRLALLPHLIAVADALAYAHDQGIIHRDLKPSNVVVGAFGETVVIDWGLAKDLRADEPDEPAAPRVRPLPARAELTVEGAVLGTPSYMAPEQAAGQPVDVRADVYALGALLFQTLTGTPPTPEPVGGAAAALTGLEPRAPADLVAIAAQALAPDRERRYASAFDLAEDLKRFQTGQLVAAHRYSLPARARRLVARHPVPAVLALALLGLTTLRHCVP